MTAPLHPVTRDEILADYIAGDFTVREIAQIHKVDVSTVYAVVRRSECHRRRGRGNWIREVDYRLAADLAARLGQAEAARRLGVAKGTIRNAIAAVREGRA